MTLLLDTCAFVWLCSDPNKLSVPAAKALDRPSNDRVLSIASIWEISIKHHNGKLPLPKEPAIWVEEQLVLQQINVLPLQRNVLYRAAALPAVHRDPFDRVIAADCLQRNLKLVTPDRPFREYGCAIVW
jgi:PIN domain nuclease of toxin-antitoxin system